MTKKDTWDEGGTTVESNWFKFNSVGDFIKGTLIDRRLQTGDDDFDDQMIYEIKSVTDGNVYNVGISVKKTGTINRLKNCKLGEIIGIKFDEEIPATKKGFSPTKVLKVKTWGLDPNYDAMEGGDEVGPIPTNEM
jgi:hypothetical protein